MSEEIKKLDPEDLKNAVNINDLEQVAGGGIGVTDPAEKAFGVMPCPQCGGFIQFSIEDINKNSFICSHCGLRFYLTGH